MNLYVASSWRNPHQQAVVIALRAAGHTVYDFRHPRADLAPEHPDNRGFAWSEIDPAWQRWTPSQFRAALAHPLAGTGFRQDMTALKACDACVLVQPCGRSAHLELGYAVGAGKLTLVILADDQEPELMLAMADHICLDLAEAVSVLASYEQAPARPGAPYTPQFLITGAPTGARTCQQCRRIATPLPSGRCSLCNGGWFLNVTPQE